MKLADFLESTGWSKADLARKFGLSRAAIGKWDEVPEERLAELGDVLSGEEVPPKIVRKCHPGELPDDELKVIIRSREVRSDWDICQENGWRVWEFNEAIAGWVKRNPWRGL